MNRAQKRQHTRDVIVDVATQLFLDQGFDGTTMDQVADHAGISRRTLFRYFPSKVDLVFPAQDERLAYFRGRLNADPTMPSRMAVRSACLDIARVYTDASGDVLAQHTIVMSSPALIAAELELDQQWQAELEARLVRDHDPMTACLLAGGVMGLVRAALLQWYRSDCTLDLVTLGPAALDLILPPETTP